MAADPLNPAARQPDVPLSLALLVAVGFLALFAWLKAPAQTEFLLQQLAHWATANQNGLVAFGLSASFNGLWLTSVIRTQLKRLRSKTGTAKTSESRSRWKLLMATHAVALPLTYWVARQFPLRPILIPGWSLTPTAWQAALAVTFYLSLLGIGSIGRRLLGAIPSRGIFWPWAAALPRVPQIRDGIILGAIHERGLDGPQPSERRSLPEWLLMGLKGLTGNIFITGVIGSGKSQILLQFLKQVLAHFTLKPAMLAIDPKRTFVRELRRIIEAQGLADRLLWISLDGDVRFNPIWREELLKNSAFTMIANSLRLASVNFLGSSSDNRFWEQSSFNLLKNALIYCAAKYDYFTFRELYRSLVVARDEGLAEDLVNCLNNPERTTAWDAEERANIEMAIGYFRDEFAQMDQKIRTSILATATSFLNEFLEYRVSRVLSPARGEISLPSMAGAVQSGKLICLHIENDALARSIGTLLKLLFQEAVLARVTDANHDQARHALLVMDEYQDVATSGGGAGLGDDRFLAKARESKAITIAATQSVSSLENAIRSEPATREILQNFRTRIFGNSTDPKTIRLFQEPHGQVERERSSHSFSESAQDARRDALFGGYDSQRSSISESVSTHTAMEYPITAREFSRLRTFEAFAQVFDGLETRFEKLFLKPHFLKTLRTPHRKILQDLRESARVHRVHTGDRALATLVLALCLAAPMGARADVLFPNVCSVIKNSEFSSCLDFQVGACMCGWPIPRPCAQISYYVPQTFIEVWPDSRDSFFTSHPAAVQLAAHSIGSALPFGVEDDNSTFTFQARAIAVPLSSPVFTPLPCQGARLDKPCFDLMSEDLGGNWRDGKADLLQPSFLAWQLSPKACLLKGAGQGVAGGVTPSLGPDMGGCSFPQGFLPKYPPTSREACNGWGVFLPRHGVYHGASRAGAALMVAARLKSIGTEVTRMVPGDPDEVWQMLYPQTSSCFREGANLGALETWKGVREEQRMFGKPRGYLFVVWKRASCCRDIPEAPAAFIAIQALRLACQAVPGGT